MEPDRLAVAVDDQGRVLAGGLLSGGLLGGDEYVSRARPRSVGVDLDGRRAEIGPRAKSPRQARPPGRGGRPGAPAPPATKGAAQRDPGRSGREGTEEPPARDPHFRPFVTRPPTQTHPFVRRQRCHTHGTTLRLPHQVDSRTTGPLTSRRAQEPTWRHNPTADRPTPMIFPEKAQICKVQSTLRPAASACQHAAPFGLAFSFLAVPATPGSQEESLPAAIGFDTQGDAPRRLS